MSNFKNKKAMSEDTEQQTTPIQVITESLYDQYSNNLTNAAFKALIIQAKVAEFLSKYQLVIISDGKTLNFKKIESDERL